jgi:hypothetical protein
MTLTVTFMDAECFVVIRHYTKPANIHISLWSETDGPVVTASVNVDYLLPPGHVAIKDYSENRGVLEALITSGIVADTGQRLPIGYTHAHLCRLLVEGA